MFDSDFTNRPRVSSPLDALHGIVYPDNVTPEELAAQQAAQRNKSSIRAARIALANFIRPD